MHVLFDEAQLGFNEAFVSLSVVFKTHPIQLSAFGHTFRYHNTLFIDLYKIIASCYCLIEKIKSMN